MNVYTSRVRKKEHRDNIASSGITTVIEKWLIFHPSNGQLGTINFFICLHFCLMCFPLKSKENASKHISMNVLRVLMCHNTHKFNVMHINVRVDKQYNALHNTLKTQDNAC